jgi:hypothetical protein
MTTEPVESGTVSQGARRDAEKGKGSGPAADVAAARAELAATLDALQDKLNVPKRIRIAAEENPLGLAAVGAALAAVVAGSVWLAVRFFRR